MYEDKDCIIFEAEKDRVEDHPLEIGDEPGSLHHGPVHKELIHQIMLHEDEDTGMSVSLVRYTKGEPSAVHRHICGKGEYVLRGRSIPSMGISVPARPSGGSQARSCSMGRPCRKTAMCS